MLRKKYFVGIAKAVQTRAWSDHQIRKWYTDEFCVLCIDSTVLNINPTKTAVKLSLSYDAIFQLLQLYTVSPCF